MQYFITNSLEKKAQQEVLYNLEQLLKSADKLMYDEKERYHREKSGR